MKGKLIVIEGNNYVTVDSKRFHKLIKMGAKLDNFGCDVVIPDAIYFTDCRQWNTSQTRKAAQLIVHTVRVGYNVVLQVPSLESVAKFIRSNVDLVIKTGKD